MSFQMLILISVLYFAAHSEAIWKLQENVYVIDSEWNSDSPPEKVYLYCNGSERQNTSVYWKKDGAIWCKPRSNCEGALRYGARLEVTVKEPRDAGNFTCWSATNDLLSYTTLYVAKIDKGKVLHQFFKTERPNSNLKCTTNNYSGNFTCSWTMTSQRLDRKLKIAVRSKNTDNISESATCEKPIRDPTTLQSYSVTCKKERPCPGVEEYQQTEMVLEVFDKNQYENDTVSFFVKDIIKPDATACEIVRNGTAHQLIWKPPQTWSTPLSYFGLTYRIKTIGTSQQIYEVDNPTQLENGNRLGCSFKSTGNKIYYIQSRDRYNEKSAWSEWSKPCRSTLVKRRNFHSINHVNTSGDEMWGVIDKVKRGKVEELSLDEERSSTRVVPQKNGQDHHTHHSKRNIAPCKSRRT